MGSPDKFHSPFSTGRKWLPTRLCPTGASQVALVVKNPPASAGDISEVGSIPGLGRSARGGNGNPPQYSCLENPRDRGAWWAPVYGVAQSRTRLTQLSSSSSSLHGKQPVQGQALTPRDSSLKAVWFKIISKSNDSVVKGISTGNGPGGT